MELIKKIFSSILILVGIAAMVVAVFAAVMMIGKVSIFGVSYVNAITNKEITIKTSGADKMIDENGTVAKIVIKTNRVTPQIEYFDKLESKNLSVKLSSNLQGFAKGDVKSVSLKTYAPTEVFDGSTKVLTIETIEPEGLFFTNNSVLKVCLPRKMSLSDVEIEVGGAKSIVINGNAVKENIDELNPNGVKEIVQMHLNTLKITQKEANYNGLTIGNIAKWRITNSNGQITGHDEKINLTVKNLEIKTVAGRVNVGCPIANDLTIESDSGTFIFNTYLDAPEDGIYKNSIGGSAIIKGGSPSIEFGTIENSIIDKAKKQQAYSITKQFSIAGLLSVQCNALVQVSGEVGDSVSLNKNGATLRANVIKGDLYAESGCGGIVIIDNVGGLILIGTSTDVDVTVNDVFINEIHGYATIKSNNKPVVINKLVGATCSIESNRGDIRVKSIDSTSTVNLLAKNASIYANFTGSNISGENNLKATGNGNINVKFLDGQKFKLFAKARSKDKIKINLITFNTSELDPKGDIGGYKYYEEEIYGNTDDSNQVNLSAEYGVIRGQYPKED